MIVLSTNKLKKIILFFFCTTILWAFSAHAQVYDFKTLYHELKYDQTFTYFGSTQTQIESLTSYINKEDPIYQEINDYLRFHPQPYVWYGTPPKEAKRIVQHLDTIFQRVPELPQELILFRGLTLDWRGNKSFNEGEEFIDNGYVSTSTTFSVVGHFARGLGDLTKQDARGAIFTIYFNRPHQKGLLINQGEDEVILKHGLRFRVMKRKIGEGPDHYLIQVCGTSPCAIRVRDPDLVSWWVRFITKP